MLMMNGQRSAYAVPNNSRYLAIFRESQMVCSDGLGMAAEYAPSWNSCDMYGVVLARAEACLQRDMQVSGSYQEGQSAGAINGWRSCRVS